MIQMSFEGRVDLALIKFNITFDERHIKFIHPMLLKLFCQFRVSNIVFGDNVTGTVNGAFKRTPLHQVLDALLRVRGYGYRIIGETLVVMKLQEVGNMKPLAKTAIILVLMTSSLVGQSLDIYYEKGVKEVIYKPFWAERLFQCIKDLLLVDFKFEDTKPNVNKRDSTRKFQTGELNIPAGLFSRLENIVLFFQ